MKRKPTYTLLPAIILTVLLAVMMTVGAGASGFTDVPADSYYAPAVQWALDNGVTTGTSETTFSPSDTCTRGQVVTFLWRASGCPEPDAEECPFTDVAPGSYYEKAVLWAVEYGITNGTSATEFSPDATCTCAHILTFLWRSLEEAQPIITDILPGVDPNAYYAKPWTWAADNDMLRNMEDSFDIGAPCSRAMTVTWLYRAARGWDPDVPQRKAVSGDGAVCGVYYAGGLAGGDLGSLLAGLEKEFPFLASIPEVNIVKTEGGNDVFVIIPKSPDAAVSVARWIVDESSGYSGAKGEYLYMSNYGQPIVLCCNVSDIMPDTVVSVTLPASEGGVGVIFNPCVSLKNGRVSVNTLPELNGQYASGKFTDLTPYPSDASLAAPTGIRWEPDASMEPDAGGVKASWDAVPGAAEYVVKYYTRWSQDGAWTLTEYLNPDDPEASYFCQDYYELRLDVCAVSDNGFGPVTSVILTEEEFSAVLMGQ